MGIEKPTVSYWDNPEMTKVGWGDRIVFLRVKLSGLRIYKASES